MLFSTLKNIEKCPFTYWLNGRWFLQIVDTGRDSWNLYPLYILYSLVLILYLKCGGGWGGGGGVMFFSHFMLFTTFLEQKIIWECKKYYFFEKNNYFSFRPNKLTFLVLISIPLKKWRCGANVIFLFYFLKRGQIAGYSYAYKYVFHGV